MQRIAIDTLCFYTVSTSLTWLLTVDSKWLWACFPVAVFGVYQVSQTQKRTESSLDTFKALKIVSSVGALFVVNLAQMNWTFGAWTIAVILGVNMLEAAGTELYLSRWHGIPNALCGFLLVLMLFSEASRMAPMAPNPQGRFAFPLSTHFVLGYTLWNLNFCYGVGFAWSFRLILLSPLLVSYVVLGQPYTWLGARTYSLVLNQALRGSSAGWMFVPGKSYVTKLENTQPPDPEIQWCWGVLNLIFLLWCYAEGALAFSWA